MEIKLFGSSFSFVVLKKLAKVNCGQFWWMYFRAHQMGREIKDVFKVTRFRHGNIDKSCSSEDFFFTFL